jgi:hypothetical protein
MEITFLNVTPILTKMKRNAIGTPQLGECRCPHGVWLVGHPGLAHGGDVIDVDAKGWHVGKCSGAACNDCMC